MDFHPLGSIAGRRWEEKGSETGHPPVNVDLEDIDF